MNYRGKTIEMLEEYDSLKASIENMTREIKEIEQEEATISGIDYNKEKITTSQNTGSSTENEALKKIAKVERLQKKIEITDSKIKRINTALEVLDETDRTILENLYIKARPYFAFTHKVFMSERQCRTRKNRALTKVMKSIFGDDDVRGM